jgi:hypothetical protein
LEVVGDCSGASTVLDIDAVNSVGVKDKKGGVAGLGAEAKHACVVELDFQPHFFERNRHELLAGPFLSA